MIYNKNFIEFLKEKTGLAYYNGPRTEIITRCPKCEPDSKKNHGHLYISCQDPLFNCFKCEYSGIVSKLIVLLNGDSKHFIDPEYLNYKPSKIYKEDLFSDQDREDYVFEEEEKDELTIFKESYLKGRIGDIDLSIIPGLVYHLKDFLEKNNIIPSYWTMEKIEKLDSNFVGFITTRGTKMVLRNCNSNDEFRYHNCPLITGSRFFGDFYGIKNNRVSEGLNTVVLCEGIFDLLVAITDDSFKELKENSCYWAASLGKRHYLKTLISVLDYCRIPKANVVILSDKDLVENSYKMFYDLPFVQNVEIYWNKYGKDFGSRPIYPLKYHCNKGVSRNATYKQYSKNY